MKLSHKINDAKVRDEKIKLMQARQKQWMEERSDGPNITNCSRPLSGTDRAASGKESTTISAADSKKNKDMLLWTAKNPEYPPENFVVRNKSKKPSSARSERSIISINDSTKAKSKARHPSSHSKANISKYSDETKQEQGSTNPGGKQPQSRQGFSTVDVSSLNRSNCDNPASNSTNYDHSFYEDQVQTEVTKNLKSLELYKGYNDLEKEPKTMFEMHCCSSCRKLMYQKSNFPYLIIPCGHNICALCLPRHSDCPTCHSKMSSTVENTMLCQIIAQHQDQQARDELARKETEARKYIDEYATLDTRCDVLTGKADEVTDNMEQITSNLVEKKAEMKYIEENGAEIRKQIYSLQQKLAQCENEYGLHSKECGELELTYEKENEHLDMLKSTLHQVNGSKERVKTLIQSFIPSFRFEDCNS